MPRLAHCGNGCVLVNLVYCRICSLIVLAKSSEFAGLMARDRQYPPLQDYVYPSEWEKHSRVTSWLGLVTKIGSKSCFRTIVPTVLPITIWVTQLGIDGVFHPLSS